MPVAPPKKPFNGRALPLQACKELVLKHHYSHRLPASVQLCYGDIDYGPPRVTRACALFSNATGRWEQDLWELTRLVRLSNYTYPLTMLISKALGHIRQHKLIDLIVSFADSEEDHHGGIYQACSWVYDGCRNERLDGFNIDGEFVPARTCNAIYGTSSVDVLQSKLPNKSITPHMDAGKHCYWKALSKTGMRKAVGLGLCSNRYPQPMLGSDEATNVKLGDGHNRKGIIKLPGYIPPRTTQTLDLDSLGDSLTGG